MPRVLFNKTIISRTPSTPHPCLVLFALLSSFLPFFLSFLTSFSHTLVLSTPDLKSRLEIPTPTNTNSQTLPQPVAQLRLTELCQIVHALLAQVDVLQLRDVLGRGAADALDDDGGVRLKDDTVVDNLIDGQREEVVVLDDRALVYRLPVSCVSSGPSLLFPLPRDI
jgi:hypothetical protein